MTQAQQDRTVDHKAQFADGVATFSLLFIRWMDGNNWSHPIVVSLAKAAMGGVGWLHSSQISGLRHGTLLSPGPRTFVAIERLNYYIHRYRTERFLIPGTDSSNAYSEADAILEDGAPPPLGWWVEVFCGQRIPKDIDLRTNFFTERAATEISKNWGALIRKLIRDQDRDLIVELDRILREDYPCRDTERLRRVRAVIENRHSWSSDELKAELPAISSLTARLGGPTNEDQLLKVLLQP